jgi:hypothetical protein
VEVSGGGAVRSVIVVGTVVCDLKDWCVDWLVGWESIS